MRMIKLFLALNLMKAYNWNWDKVLQMLSNRNLLASIELNKKIIIAN